MVGWILGASMLFLSAVPCGAAGPGPAPARGRRPARTTPATRSRSQLAAKTSELPRDAITGPFRQRVLKIIDRPVVHSIRPTKTFTCHPRLLEWLFDHPALVSDCWRELGVNVGSVTDFEDGYECQLDKRTRVRFHVVCQRPNLRILYCVGEAKRALVPGKTRAEMVIVQRYRYWRRPDGNYFVAHQLEGFATAKAVALRAILKVAHGTADRVVDRMLRDMMVYFSVICRTMQVHPEWTHQTLAKIQHRFPPEHVDELRGILDEVYRDSGVVRLGARERATPSRSPRTRR